MEKNYNIKMIESETNDELTLKYKEHILKSIDLSIRKESKINNELLNLVGYSGELTRHFYNNLLNFPDVRYLEIGTWKGSSFCSAVYKNNVKATCIDNWSEFAEAKSIFKDNIKKFGMGSEIKLIEKDCFSVNSNELNLYNFYLYDGNHKGNSHYLALTHFINSLDNTFIYIVDDWNWVEYVQEPTYLAIKDLNLEIQFKYEITCELNVREAWWNGIGIFILKKKKK